MTRLAASPEQREAPPAAPRRARSVWWVVLAVLLVSGTTTGLLTATVQQVEPPTAAENVDKRAVSFVERQLQAANAPDAAFAVVRDGEVTASGATGSGITPDSPMLVGSLSKPVTSLAVMRLVDAGTIDLDAPVREYLPWFTTADSADIRVRHLLEQTSGLPTSAGLGDLNTPEVSLEERVRAVSEVATVSEPGTRFHYCNKNFATLGLIVEEVTGRDYADHLQDEVLDPLEMADTYTDMDRARDNGMVEGAAVLFGAGLPRTAPAFPGALPDGFLVTTANDLAHLVQVQSDGTYEGKTVVSAASLKAMHEPAVGTGDGVFPITDRYALGWGTGTLDGNPVVAHDGDHFAYHADVGMLPEQKAGLIVLTARNGQLYDPAEAYEGGMAVLAGLPEPPVEYAFLSTYLTINTIGAITVVILAATLARIPLRLRRARERSARDGAWRAVLLPGLAWLAGGVALYAGVFFGLGMTMDFIGPMPVATAFDSAPDITVLVLAAVGTLVLRGLIILAAGPFMLSRSRATRPTPTP
ncbi:CubicO group peptidase (beta-lactamase class C family) [Murinocardiopsis flavida]|uniref:CubicO group peptidase (Beta-lactamase class C family) n=1 Tax=Murinocardiopsis flavida TaxID=645275 RepID=A0A2P8DUI3_9ACTN|nr:serine hydrolase domain-containing protein [Murinocardiopsis flavida]PSL00855.1 CubicO group peptidase (beta-lactamase class C family) [Murinocardiopsis flavida]